MDKDSKTILFIIIGLIVLTAIGVSIYLITKPKSTPPSNTLCTLKNLNGTCPPTYKCNNQGLCSLIQPVSSPCTPLNPSGNCSNLGWTCSNGTCIDPSSCSASNPKGSCTQYGTVCVGGQCIVPQSTDCSPTNLKGNCPTGLTCLSGRCLPPSVPYCTGISDNCNDPTSCICPTNTPFCGTAGKCSIPYCTGNSDNCNDPTSCTCPSNTPICNNGKCTQAPLPDCSTDPSKLICNISCTCPPTGNCSNTGTTTGKCIPNCGPDDDCSTGSCMCPNEPGDPLRYCDNTRRCSIQGSNCTQFQVCGGGNCTCPIGFTCKASGYCVQDNIFVYSADNVVELPTDVYIKGQGGYHRNSVVGCWTLDDGALTALKGGSFGKGSEVTQIKLPANVKATAYFASYGWDDLCTAAYVNTTLCDPGKITIFTGDNQWPSGFKFEYA